MAEIQKLDLTVGLWSLLRRPIILHEIRLSQPRVLLEKNADGAANWEFDKQGPSDASRLPVIEALFIDRGSLSFRDPTTKTDMVVEVSSAGAGNSDQEQMLNLDGRGRFKAQAATIRGRVGSLLSLRDTAHPYALKIDAVLGNTKASAEGTVSDPLHLKAEDVNFVLEGPDLAQLFPIIGVPLPPTPPYKLAGHLKHSGDLWTFSQFKGSVGSSDLAGDFSVDRGRQPQLITAQLTSRNLDMNDLGGFIGADRGEKASPTPPRADKVLPVEPYSLEKLRVADADVTFKGEKIITQKMPLERMNAHLLLKGGVLKLDPLNFAAAGGNIVSQISMDARQAVIATRSDIKVKGLHLDQLIPGFKLTAASAGTIGGRIKLDSSGNSLAKMLASSNGEAALLMDGGSISELLLRLSNLDVANAIGVLIKGDKQVPVRCMVSQWKVAEGDFQTQTFIIETPKVNIGGTGHVDMKDETINLRLVAKQKDFSLASLRGPILVTGTLKHPVVRPEMGQVVTRGALAALLGAATAGLGTLIPLLEFGKGEDSECGALIRSAKADVAAPPGTTAGKAPRARQ
jgi:uncharacterized protein involved in outer membrane biogenesis